MGDGKLSPIWVERVIDKHPGPAAEVQAHFRALGLSEKKVASALRAWADRHNVTLGAEFLALADEARRDRS
jgi:hypothetical protein